MNLLTYCLRLNIGSWCVVQRQMKEKLTNVRKQKLEAISGWGWGKKFHKWEENYALLEDFVKEYDKIPHISELYKGIKIGRWCNAQRKIGDKLTDVRKKQLEAISGWYWKN